MADGKRLTRSGLAAAPLVLRREGCDGISSDRRARHGPLSMGKRNAGTCSAEAVRWRLGRRGGVITLVLGGVSPADDHL
jgi:hypothetical protein